MNLPESLINWYSHHKRDLPWRRISDPYRIWLSEVILQQTRVNQGMDYYLRFIEQFPDVYSLAYASEEEVLSLWQGLGYYSRARNLHQAARTIVKDYQGKFPSTYQELIKLKGIGEYTAAAIASISFGEPVPVVDGNVARVLSRLFALEEPIDSSSGKKNLRWIAGSLIPVSIPATFNQAIMEFGALHCKPGLPDCATCVLKEFCRAFQENRVAEFPRKNKKRQPVELYLYYLIFKYQRSGKQMILLQKRIKNGIWKNLYDFPCLESLSPMELPEILRHPFIQSLFWGAIPAIAGVSAVYPHQLTHRMIRAQFIECEGEEIPLTLPGIIAVDQENIRKYPIPRLIEKYLERQSL